MAEKDSPRSARAVLVLFLVLFVGVMGLLYTSMYVIDSDRAETVIAPPPPGAP